MPTRSYYFPENFVHYEKLLLAEDSPPSEEALEPFREKNIPPLISVNTIATFLGVSPKTLHSIITKPAKHYRYFEIRKKDGSRREISTPRTYLKVIQWWINDNIFAMCQPADCVYGFVRGRSAVMNAEQHKGAQHLLNADIQDFFPSIQEDRVTNVFIDIGYAKKVAEQLAGLCCLGGSVPQGAPTSPAIANFVLKDLDAELVKLAEGQNLRYTRYADDLTFSGAEFIPPELVTEVTNSVIQAGFELNNKKTRFAGQGNRLEVTGVTINKVHQPSRKWRKNTRARIHRLSFQNRIIRKDLFFLYGINGVAGQFPESPSMQAIKADATKILELKKGTVIGMGPPVDLPNDLSIKQSMVLAKLNHNTTNAAIASELGISVSTVKQRLTIAFRKIGVSNRFDAYRWARENL